jgi:hypothetical protein
MPAKLDNQEFIKRSTTKHNGKYNYSLSEYVNSSTKIAIVCPVHGRFEQRPADHMNGCGCCECRNQSISDRSRLNRDDFIRRAKEIHNNRYDYEKVVYVSTEKPVILNCSIHGDFSISPHSHIGQKAGCKKCGIIQRVKVSKGKARNPFYRLSIGRKILSELNDNYKKSLPRKRNFVYKEKSSIHKGVTKSGYGWKAFKRIDHKHTYLGFYKTEEEAAKRVQTYGH